MPNPLPWDEAPDIEWSCVMFQGRPLLVIQATGPLMSAGLLSWECKTVETRFLFDPDKLPDLVPYQFICFADGKMDAPLLACEPDPMLMPVRRAITDKRPWMLVLQVTVDGKRHMKLIEVRPDDSTEIITTPDGSPLWPRWIVGIR